MGRKGTIFWITLVLFVLPLASMYYLNDGLRFRKGMVDILKSKGHVGLYDVVDEYGQPLSPSVLRGRSVSILTNVLDDKAAHRVDGVKKTLESLGDIVVIGFVEDSARVTRYRKERGALWNPVLADSAVVAAVGMNGSDRSVLLVDTAGLVRNYYDIGDSLAMRSLILHTAYITPHMPKPTFEVLRRKK